MPEWSLWAVFLTGILGGLHCLGMCGGIVGALSMQRGRAAAPWPFHLAYNAGRIGSYTLAGMMAGALGQAALLMDHLLPIQKALYLLASLLLILVGLYLAGLSRWVVFIEQAGNGLWTRLQPLTRPLLPVRRVQQAAALGALWGWLPCGLVYSVLLLALASGSWRMGALTMMTFGLGTLPNLLAMGALAGRLQTWLRLPILRLIAGLLVTAWGVAGLFMLAGLHV